MKQSSASCTRSVYEETALITKTIKKLGERLHPYIQANITCYLCKYISGKPRILDRKEVEDIYYQTYKKEVNYEKN